MISPLFAVLIFTVVVCYALHATLMKNKKLSLFRRKITESTHKLQQTLPDDVNILTVKPSRLSSFELCICGALSTAVGDLLMHPMDTIKVEQQASSKTASQICSLISSL